MRHEVKGSNFTYEHDPSGFTRINVYDGPGAELKGYAVPAPFGDGYLVFLEPFGHQIPAQALTFPGVVRRVEYWTENAINQPSGLRLQETDNKEGNK